MVGALEKLAQKKSHEFAARLCLKLGAYIIFDEFFLLIISN